MQHRPRKRFGQNFLQSTYIIDAILKAFNPQPEDKVIEIGPGHGALTKPLLKKLMALTAIEIDRDLYETLRMLPEADQKLTLINEDALSIDFSRFGNHLRILGNLPYNISTPLIIHLLHHIEPILDMHFMLQKEVVERMVAQPGGKTYGRLSVMVQYFCEAEWLFDVPPEVFFPKPKVDSAFIRLTPYQTSPYSKISFQTLERVVAQAFSMRRKTLANTLKPLMDRIQLESLDISPTLRPEQISIEQYVKIARFVTK